VFFINFLYEKQQEASEVAIDKRKLHHSFLNVSQDNTIKDY